MLETKRNSSLAKKIFPFAFSIAILSTAGKSQGRGVNMFNGLDLPGKEFLLPDISSLWLIEEFVVHRDVSDQIQLESYPTSILDESCLLDILRYPSVPLVELVETFVLGLIDSPFGHYSVKSNVDSPLIEKESHVPQPVGLENAECLAVSPDLAHNQTVQSDDLTSNVDSDVSSENLQLAVMEEQVEGDQ